MQGLIDVHEHEGEFLCAALTEAEAAVPTVFPLKDARKAVGDAAVVRRAGFQRAYELFTENLLRDLNWDGVFAAGGSVLACLQPLPAECDTNRKKRKHMHDVGFPGSDIDLFLYGLSAEQATAKILEIYETVSGKPKAETPEAFPGDNSSEHKAPPPNFEFLVKRANARRQLPIRCPLLPVLPCRDDGVAVPLPPCAGRPAPVFLSKRRQAACAQIES